MKKLSEFKPSDVEKLLADCHRRCCVCHKFCGVKIEIDHAKPRSEKGSGKIENAIPLCFECHAEVHHYNPAHPKGKKFSPGELINHKNRWLKICKENPQALISAPKDRDIGPLEAMVLELSFNWMVASQAAGDHPEWRIDCLLRNTQYDKAIADGALLLLPDDLVKKLNAAYYEIGRANSHLQMRISVGPTGSAYGELANKIIHILTNSTHYIHVAHDSLKVFLQRND